MCTMQNYAKQHEDFILAASYIAKERDKIVSAKIDLKDFWAMTLQVMMEYIKLGEIGTGAKKRKTSPSLATLCLKIVSKNNAQDMTPEQCSSFYDYIMSRKDDMISFDRASLIKSMSDVPGFTQEHLKGALELSLTDLDCLKVKDLSHLLLAYFTQPGIFTT